MSIQLIQKYYTEVDKIKRFSGTGNESSLWKPLKFNTYEFGEYKESVIELLGRVCTVSVETMKIVKEMPA